MPAVQSLSSHECHVPEAPEFLLRKEPRIRRGVLPIRHILKFLFLRDGDVVGRERRARSALEFGDGLVEIGLRLKLPAAGGEKLGLPLKNQLKSCRAGAELALLAFVKLLRRLA